MVLINTNTSEAFENVNKSQAARLVGVHRNTVSRWSKRCNIEVYNHWKIYFDIKTLKHGNCTNNI